MFQLYRISIKIFQLLLYKPFHFEVFWVIWDHCHHTWVDSHNLGSNFCLCFGRYIKFLNNIVELIAVTNIYILSSCVIRLGMWHNFKEFPLVAFIYLLDIRLEKLLEFFIKYLKRGELSLYLWILFWVHCLSN